MLMINNTPSSTSTSTSTSISTMSSNPFHYHYALHPRMYIAPHINVPLDNIIDADPNKSMWSSVPWSDNFHDIRGNNNYDNDNDDDNDDKGPNMDCRTRFKMIWDEQYLYILAMIESDFEVTATFTERNSPIFQQDSDFEVFIDPFGSCHQYKELEVNALNTVWNLMLDKPYGDGGVEHSGRIAKPGDHEQLYYDVKDQKTAVRILEGGINHRGVVSSQDDDNGDAEKKKQRNVWVVEIALNHKDTMAHVRNKIGNHHGATLPVPVPVPVPPMVGDRWRINFSRVEEKGIINWTWQQQRVWDASRHKHMGKVNMHLPDAWGYIQFGGPPQSSPKSNEMSSSLSSSSSSSQPPGEVTPEEIQKGKGDSLWPLKLAAANLYYAQQQYKATHDNTTFAKDLDELNDLVDSNIFNPFDRDSMSLSSCNKDGFVFKIYDLKGHHWVSITNDRLLTIGIDETKVATE